MFDSITGLVKSVLRGNVEIPLQQNFYYYLGMAGDNSKFEKRASGAYIFRPNTTSPSGRRSDQPSPITERVFSYQVYEGTILDEPVVVSIHSIHYLQSIRNLYKYYAIRENFFILISGPHVQEVHQVFTEWISQVIRLYDKADVVEFEWLIGPVPVE